MEKTHVLKLKILIFRKTPLQMWQEGGQYFKKIPSCMPLFSSTMAAAVYLIEQVHWGPGEPHLLKLPPTSPRCSLLCALCATCISKPHCNCIGSECFLSELAENWTHPSGSQQGSPSCLVLMRPEEHTASPSTKTAKALVLFTHARTQALWLCETFP